MPGTLPSTEGLGSDGAWIGTQAVGPQTVALRHSDKPLPFEQHLSASSHPPTHTVASSLLSASPVRSFRHGTEDVFFLVGQPSSAGL